MRAEATTSMFFITQLGDPALVLAIRKGLTDIVSLLMKAGANIDIQDKVHMKFWKKLFECQVYLTP